MCTYNVNIDDKLAYKMQSMIEMSEEDYKLMVREMPHKPFKNIERWL